MYPVTFLPCDLLCPSFGVAWATSFLFRFPLDFPLTISRLYPELLTHAPGRELGVKGAQPPPPGPQCHAFPPAVGCPRDLDLVLVRSSLLGFMAHWHFSEGTYSKKLQKISKWHCVNAHPNCAACSTLPSGSCRQPLWSQVFLGTLLRWLFSSWGFVFIKLLEWTIEARQCLGGSRLLCWDVE